MNHHDTKDTKSRTRRRRTRAGGLRRGRCRRVLVFGSHARGTPHPDSDVDLCIVADGSVTQDQAAIALRRAIGGIRGKPPLTLIPITPSRLAEKQREHDPFYETILREGVTLAEAD